MSTIIKHKFLCLTWPIVPVVVKVALHKRHRANVAKRLASERPYN